MANSPPFPPGSPLVAYLRDSGHETQELSIEQQEQELLSWCREHSYILARVYKDIGTGTTTTGRDQFLEMIRYLRSDHHEEAGLIVWKWNRFSRNIDESQFYRADLRRRGVLLHSLNDSIPPGLEGRFLEAAIDWMNQSYIEDLKADTKRGLRNLVENYGCIPGTPPMGFKREKVIISQHRDGEPHIAHRWIPDPDKTALIRQAWKLRAGGRTYREIAEKTNLFRSKNSYVSFFRNPLYIGRLEYGDDIIIDDYCDPIISKEIWEAVQVINQKNSRMKAKSITSSRRRKGSPFILSGLVFCARCGSALNGSVHLAKGHRYHYYRCNREHRRRDCDALPIPKQILEDAVKSELIDYLQHPQSIAEVQKAHNESQSKGKDDLISQKNALSADLKIVKRKIEKIIDAIVDTGHTKQMLDRMNLLEEEKTQLQQRIKELEIQLQPGQVYDLKQIEDLSGQLQNAIGKATQKQLKQIYQGVIEKIVVERDGKDKILGVINFYLSQMQTSPEEEVCAYGVYPGRESYRRHKPAGLITFKRKY